MTRRQLVGRILLVLLVLVVLAGAGYALYRWGYINGLAAADEGRVGFRWFSDDFDFSEDALKHWPWAQFNRRGSGMFDYNDHMQSMPHTFYRSPVTRSVFSRYMIYSPFSALFRLICLGFFVWAGYKIITAIFGGKGWQLSFQQRSEEGESVEAKSSAKKKS